MLAEGFLYLSSPLGQMLELEAGRNAQPEPPLAAVSFAGWPVIFCVPAEVDPIHISCTFDQYVAHTYGAKRHRRWLNQPTSC